MKEFKIQTKLVLNYKKWYDGKIFHTRAKLIASDSDINEAFKSMHQSILTKIKKYTSKNYIVLDAIVRHSVKIFEC